MPLRCVPLQSQGRGPKPDPLPGNVELFWISFVQSMIQIYLSFFFLPFVIVALCCVVLCPSPRRFVCRSPVPGHQQSSVASPAKRHAPLPVPHPSVQCVSADANAAWDFVSAAAPVSEHAIPGAGGVNKRTRRRNQKTNQRPEISHESA